VIEKKEDESGIHEEDGKLLYQVALCPNIVYGLQNL
jgi:hypothetical protein